MSAGHDDRTPVTLMLGPANTARLELVLAQLRHAFPGLDEEVLTDRIFAMGLTVSEACIEAAPDLVRSELLNEAGA